MSTALVPEPEDDRTWVGRSAGRPDDPDKHEALRQLLRHDDDELGPIPEEVRRAVAAEWRG